MIPPRTEKTKAEIRTEQVTTQIGFLLVPYTAAYNASTPEDRAKLIPPRQVHDAIAQNVAKTGKIRFKKGRPPMKNEDAYLWRLHYDHAKPGGAYLPIDSLMMARWSYGHAVCDRWETTVDLMKALNNARAEDRR